MEASENPQLPLDDGDAGGTVRAIGDRLVIDGLTVTDRRAARVVRERAEDGTPAPETVRKAIEIGARLLEDEGTVANVDYVKRELEEGIAEVKGQLGVTVEEGSEALAEQLANVFGVERTDSVQAQIKEIVTSASREQREALMTTLTAEDPSNPLVSLQVRIGKKMLEAEERHRQDIARTNELIGKLKEELAVANERAAGDERVAEAEEAGTRKGITFEERVNDALERIAGTRGDCATHTGAEGAEGGGKKGDTLVELGAADGPAIGRIVFESKDKKLSKNVAWAELNEGMAARAASFAVLVVAGAERIPSGREPLQEYEGNKLIVAVDRDEPDSLALEVAYRLAAARVTMARDRDLTVDAGEVRSVAEEALSCLKQAQAIRSALTGIKTSSDRARSGLDEMEATLKAKLERIDSLVAEAEPPSG
jgi:hypothetical protein